MGMIVNMSVLLKQIGIAGYEVIAFEDSGKHSRLEVGLPQRPSRCPCCGAGRLHSKGPYRRQARHLEAFGRKVQLFIRCRRFQCRACGKSFVQALPGLLSGRHSTEPFRERIYQLHRDGVSGKRLAEASQLGSATVERIYQQFTLRKARERCDWRCPTILGIDEHSVHRGKRLATTFCNLRTHRVFDVVEGRSSRDLAAFLMRLKGRERVRVVCIDLSSSYRQLIRRFFPNAIIVADRFHVVRLVQQHFGDLFRAVAPEIKHQRGILGALRTHPGRLKDYQRQHLQRLFARYPAIEALYEQMQELLRLLRQRSRKARQCRPLARQLLGFIQRLKESGFAALQTLAQTLRQWQQEIACMWRFTKNNGITEGFHRKMKLIQRRAYGFRNFNNYRLRVIAECG